MEGKYCVLVLGQGIILKYKNSMRNNFFKYTNFFLNIQPSVKYILLFLLIKLGYSYFKGGVAFGVNWYKLLFSFLSNSDESTIWH